MVLDWCVNPAKLVTRETHPALSSVAQLLFLVRAAVRLHVRQRTRTDSANFRYWLLIKNTLETRDAPLRCWLTVSAGCWGGRVSGKWSRGTRLLLNNRQELLPSGHVTGDGVTHFRSRWSADQTAQAMFRHSVSTQWLAKACSSHRATWP